MLLSSASLILLKGCLKLSAVFPIVAEHVVVVEICVVKVSPRRLHGDSASRDTSSRVGAGADEVVGVVLRHNPPIICKVASLSFKMGLADLVVLWWKALQDDVLVPAVRGALLGCDEI